MTEYSLDAARSIGFEDKIGTVQGYHAVFDWMMKARMIPAPAK